MVMEIVVDASSYDSTSGKISFRWAVPAGHDVGLLRDHFDVHFAPAPANLAPVEIFDMFCGCLLPHFALKTPQLLIAGLPAVTDEVHLFWSKYLELLGIACDVQFVAGTKDSIALAPHSGGHGPQPGLYFGGGVESLSLLSLIKHLKPYLLSVDGAAWMNSDYDKSSIKKHLQDQIAHRYGLEFLRTWTDLRTLFPDGDTYINRYLTGTLMYYLLAPILRHKGVAVTYIAAELEYALYEIPFDHSMHARFIHNVVRPPNPPLLSPLNAIPKIELLDGLYRRDPELCSYLYSCLFNTSRRWCGECGKCRRLSAFCEAIGIPKSLIGMQEGIESLPETGRGTTDRYWEELQRYRRRQRGETQRESATDLALSWMARLLKMLLSPVKRV